MRHLTAGVVGCGINSEKHLQAFSWLPNVRVVAVYDIDKSKALEKAGKFGIREIPADFNSMLTLGLDLIDIVTPTQTHCELTVRALEDGHNVLVEKPMAVTSKECLKMMRSARKSGRSICVMHNKRFYDSVGMTKATLREEKLTSTRMSTLHLYPHAQQGGTPRWILTEEFGGILWESMVHEVYLAEYLMGEITSAHALADKRTHPVFDSLTVVLRGEGKVSVCQTEWNAKEPVETLQLLTEQGDRFDVDLPHDMVFRKSRPYRNRNTTILRTVSDDFYDPIVKWTRHLGNMLATQSFKMALPFERTFFKLIGQYIAHLTGSSLSPPVTPEEGLRSIRVLEATRRSLRTGRTERVS